MTKNKDKDRLLKAAREKHITYKGISLRLSADFSAETLQARREWQNMFKEMKEKQTNKNYNKNALHRKSIQI